LSFPVLYLQWGEAVKLSEADYENFLTLKITRDIVDRARVFRVTREEAKEFGITLECAGGVCFPYFPPTNGNGTRSPVSFSVRQDNPVCDADGKPQRKYIAAAGLHYPYVAPVSDPERFTDPSVPVVVVEAQKSALAILRWSEDASRRFIPVGIAGCYGWRGKVGIAPNESGERVVMKGLLPALADICRGHRVYILLDENSATNPQVKRGRDWLAETLLNERVTNDVRILTLPPSVTKPGWNGPDDYLRYCGDEAFHEIFESAHRVRGKESDLPVVQCYTPKQMAAMITEPIEPLAYPVAFRGMLVVLDGDSKTAGKTTLLLHAIAASRRGEPFLNRSTKRFNVLLVSEENRRTLDVALQRAGLADENEGMYILTREDWYGIPWPTLAQILKLKCRELAIDWLILDTFFDIVGLDGDREKNSGDVGQAVAHVRDIISNLDIAVTLNRHERKSGGEIGKSGRGSSALTGAVDVVLQLRRLSLTHRQTMRQLEVIGRIDPNKLTIELTQDHRYISHEQADTSISTTSAADKVGAAILSNPNATLRELAEVSGSNKNQIAKLALRSGWTKPTKPRNAPWRKIDEKRPLY
jgi:hypothetical protein